MEIYTNTMTASTPSFGMPVAVATSPRSAAPCLQQVKSVATPWAHVAGIAVMDAVAAVRGIELDAIRVKGAFPGPTAWRPPIV
jgi:predicted protein tyrosine phosphatase